MLARAGIEVDLVETTSAQHGTQLMRTLPLGKYMAVVSVSGDGLLHEMLNGLLDRPDWPEAVRTPFAIVRASLSLHPQDAQR
jgi:sphingosine kinase